MRAHQRQHLERVGLGVLDVLDREGLHFEAHHAVPVENLKRQCGAGKVAEAGEKRKQVGLTPVRLTFRRMRQSGSEP